MAIVVAARPSSINTDSSIFDIVTNNVSQLGFSEMFAFNIKMVYTWDGSSRFWENPIILAFHITNTISTVHI